MDWNEIPAKLAGSVKVAVWHELVQEKKKLEDTEVPAYEPKSATPSIIAFWPTTEEFIEYKTQVSSCICYVLDHPLTCYRISSLQLVHFSAHYLETNDWTPKMWSSRLTHLSAHMH
jgi:hypothetical protein